ncbi:MAG: CPBP family intramembrane metalloprotease [Ruminiclostridium sp.]|nr:CPBP family intramembrane metalloprotease [Ruminiclostridium sp.]
MERYRLMNKKITLTGVNIVFFIFSTIFIFYQLAFTIIFGEKFLMDNIYLVVLINEFVVILIPVLLYTLVKKADFKGVFRIRKLDPLHGAIILLLSIAAYPVAMMLNNIAVYFLQFAGDITAQPIPIPRNLQELLVGLLVIAVSPAICEELFHRGLLLSAYERRGSMKAVAFTAVFFGIFHFDLTNFLGPVFLGLLIGYYVIRTNSIFAGILAHFLNNAMAEIIQYFFYNDQSIPAKVTVSSQELGQTIILGLGGLILTGLLLVVLRKATAGRAVIIPSISSIRNDVVSILSHWPVILTLILYSGLMVLYILSIAYMKYFGLK